MTTILSVSSYAIVVDLFWRANPASPVVGVKAGSLNFPTVETTDCRPLLAVGDNFGFMFTVTGQTYTTPLFRVG